MENYYNKITTVSFTRDKGFWHIHPMEHITNISLVLNPEFMIPRIDEFICLFYKNEYKLFRVTSIWYDYKNRQIEITVK